MTIDQKENNLITYATLTIIDKPKQNSLKWKFFDGNKMLYADGSSYYYIINKRNCFTLPAELIDIIIEPVKKAPPVNIKIPMTHLNHRKKS
jgi:hypothetical protein